MIDFPLREVITGLVVAGSLCVCAVFQVRLVGIGLFSLGSLLAWFELSFTQTVIPFITLIHNTLSPIYLPLLVILSFILLRKLFFPHRWDEERPTSIPLYGTISLRKRRWYISLGLSIFLFFTLQNAIAGIEEESPLLEEFLVKNTLGRLDQISGGYNDSMSLWMNTLDDLETLNMLNETSRLSTNQIHRLHSYILAMRSRETDENNQSQYVHWWGSIKKSVQALRILQLLGYPLDEFVAEVENRTLLEYYDKGLYWSVDGVGWDDTEWGIRMAYEYGLFDVLPSLGIHPMTQETLDMLASVRNAKQFEELITMNQSQKLLNVNQTLSWSPILQELHQITSESDPYQISVPGLFEILDDCLIDEYVPFVTLNLSWTTEGIPNYENVTYGIDSGAYFNQTSVVCRNVTNSEGEIYEINVEEESEVWGRNELHYDMVIQLVTEDDELVMEKILPFEPADSTVQADVSLDHLNNSHQYYIQVYSYQSVHEESVEPTNTSFEESIPDFPNEILENETIPENESLTFEMIDEGEEVLEDYIIWELVNLEVPVEVIATIYVPSYTFFSIDNPYTNTSVYADMGTGTYEGYIWDSRNDDSIPLYISAGENLLGIKNVGQYQVLLTPTLLNEAEPADGIHLWSYECSRDYRAYWQIQPYWGIFNQSVYDLPTLHDQIDMVTRVADTGILPKLINEEVLLEQLFWYYNETTLLFEHDIYESVEMTLNTWQALDIVGMSDMYLSKDHYDALLNEFMTQNYKETLDKDGRITAISITNEDESLREAALTRLFVEFLTYDNSWMDQSVPVSRQATMRLANRGAALDTTPEPLSQEDLYSHAYQELYDTLTDEEQLQVSHLLPSADTTQDPTILRSFFLSPDDMFWFPEPFVVDPIDQVFLLIVALGICIVLMGGVVELPAGRSLGIICGGVLLSLISVQSVVTPIMFNGSVTLLSEYLRLTTVLVGMLEEGIYNISTSYTAELGLILRPNPSDTDMITQPTHSTESLVDQHLLSELANIGNSTSELYQEYLSDFRDIKTREAQLILYNTDHITARSFTREEPLSYKAFLQNVAFSEISIAVKQVVDDISEEWTVTVDRQNQRASAWNWLQHFSSVFDDLVIWLKPAGRNIVEMAGEVKWGDTIQDATDMGAVAASIDNYEEVFDAMNTFSHTGTRYFGGVTYSPESISVTRSLDAIMDPWGTVVNDGIMATHTSTHTNAVLSGAMRFMGSRVMTDDAFGRIAYRICGNHFGGTDLFNTMVIPFSSDKGAFLIDDAASNICILTRSLDDDLLASLKGSNVYDSLMDARIANYYEVTGTFEESLGYLDAPEYAKVSRAIIKNTDGGVDDLPVTVCKMGEKNVRVSQGAIDIDEVDSSPIGGRGEVSQFSDTIFDGMQARVAYDQWHFLEELRAAIKKRGTLSLDKNTISLYYEKSPEGVRKLHEDFKTIDFSKRSPLSLNRSKLENPRWKPIQDFLVESKLAPNAKSKMPRVYTIDMEGLDNYQKGLEKHLRFLATRMITDSEGSRSPKLNQYIAHLIKDGQLRTRIEISEYTKWWHQWGYNGIYYTKTNIFVKWKWQKNATAMDTLRQVSLEEIQAHALLTKTTVDDEVVIPAATNIFFRDNFTKNIDEMTRTLTDTNGNPLTAEQYISIDTLTTKTSITGEKRPRFELDQTNENCASAAAFKDKHETEVKLHGKNNTLQTYLTGLQKYAPEDLYIDIESGKARKIDGVVTDLSGNIPSGTYMVDVLVRYKDKNGAILAGIELKGLSQSDTIAELKDSSTIFQNSHLIKMQNDLGIDVAQIHIRAMGENGKQIIKLKEGITVKTINWDWTVSTADTNPLNAFSKGIAKLLSDDIEHGVEPLLHRNARSSGLIEDLWSLTKYDPRLSYSYGRIDKALLDSYLPRFQERIENALKVYNKFYGASETLDEADVTRYWNDITARWKSLEVTDFESLSVFSQEWQKQLRYHRLQQMADVVKDCIIGDIRSPMCLSPTEGMLWNTVDATSSLEELQTLADLTAATYYSDELKCEEVLPVPCGYFAGELGDASFTFLTDEASVLEGSINWYWPSALENLDFITIGDYTIDGTLEDGIRYAAGSDEYTAFSMTNPGKYVWIRGHGENTYSGWHYTGSAGKENFIRVGLPGIEYCTGIKDLNITEYPLLSWAWMNDPQANQEGYYLTDSNDEENCDAKSANNSQTWTNFDWNQAQLSFLLKDSEGNTKWVHFVSTPDQSIPSTTVGPQGYEVFLDPIVYLQHREYDPDGGGDENFFYFEAPVVYEQVNLLEYAREAGLEGDDITLMELAFGSGYRNLSSTKGNDLYLGDLTFTKVDEGIHGYSQGAAKVLYQEVTADLGDDWEAYLKTNQSAYELNAMELACGLSIADNGVNAYEWYKQALQADLHYDFRHFYTTGIIVVRDSGDSEFYTKYGFYPVRGLILKTKEWPLTQHALTAPVYSLKEVYGTTEVLVYYDPAYENGWDSDLWTYAVLNLKSALFDAGYDTSLASAEEMLEFMQRDPVEGMVILLGAIPDMLWDYKHPYMSLENMDKADYETATEEFSILERYLENGGVVVSTGQYGGGWKIAFYDHETGETTITDYNDATNNPTGENLGVDIGEILRDRSFADDSYVPTTASFMNTNPWDPYYPYVGTYYSLGLRDVSSTYPDDCLRRITYGDGDYDDQIWWVQQDWVYGFTPSDTSGQFVSFHTAMDNVSMGAVTMENVDFWLEDLLEIILGTNVESPSGGLDDLTGIIPSNRQYPGEESSGESNASFYWYDTFDNTNDDDLWSDLTQQTYNGMKVGQMSTNQTHKDINMVNVSEYPFISADVFGAHNPAILSNGNFQDYTNWTHVTSGKDWDWLNDTNGIPIEGTSCHQFYYENIIDDSFGGAQTDVEEQGGYITISDNGILATEDTFFHAAVNPYKITSYEIPPSTTLLDTYLELYYSTASEWWLEFEIDDGSGSNKFLRYYFTLETPVWYRGSLFNPEAGFSHDKYWYIYGGTWLKGDRINNNYDGIRWIAIDGESDFTSGEIWDGSAFPGELTDTTRESQWTIFDRNILYDYNSLFEQAAESVTVTKVSHNGHFMAGAAFVMLDDFAFYTVDTDKKYVLDTELTDGEHTVHVYFAASSDISVDIDQEDRDLGEVWKNENGEYCYLTGSILPQTGTFLDDTTGDGWVSIGGDVLEAVSYLLPYVPRLDATALFYTDEVTVNSWTTNIYLDNIVISGGQFTNPPGTYYFNDVSGLALEVEVELAGYYVKRNLGSDYYLSDYGLVSFDLLAETTDSAAFPAGKVFVELYKDSSPTGYRAYLTPDSNPSGYYLGGNVMTRRQWYPIDLALNQFRDADGDTPPIDLQYDAIYFCFNRVGTYWIDNFQVTGVKGILVWDDFSDAPYHSEYSEGSLSEDYTDDFGWYDQSNYIDLSIAHPNLLVDSPVMVDVQEQDQLLVVMRGDDNSSATLTMYAYKEDSTKLTGDGSSITIWFTDANLLNGWDTPVTQVVDLSSLSSSARFLACPVISTGGDWVLDVLSPIDQDDIVPTIYVDTDNTVMNATIGTHPPFYEGFESQNLNDWGITLGSSVSFTINDGVFEQSNGVDGGYSVVAPTYDILLDNFTITFRTRVTAEDFTGWALGDFDSNQHYRCWVDIDDTTMPRIDVENMETYEHLIENVQLDTDIADNEWMVFKIRREGSSFQMWVNGQQVMDTIDNAFTAPYRFGFHVCNSWSKAEFTDLSIKPITDYVLETMSEDIINPAWIETPPIASWDLTTKYLDPNDDPEDGEVYRYYDISGKGTQHNSMNVDATNTTYDEDEGCYYFDGTDDQIDFGSGWNPTNNFSVTAWVKTTQNAAGTARYRDPSIIGTNGFSGLTEDWTLANYNGKLAWYDQFGGVAHSHQSSTTINDDQWHQVAAVRDNANIYLYVDGRKVDTISSASGTIRDHTIYLGRFEWSDALYYKGYLAAAEVYNYALAHEEILSLYTDLSLIEPFNSVSITTPYNHDEWTVNGEFYLPQNSIGEFLMTTLEGDDMVITATDVDAMLSMDVDGVMHEQFSSDGSTLNGWTIGSSRSGLSNDWSIITSDGPYGWAISPETPPDQGYYHTNNLNDRYYHTRMYRDISDYGVTAANDWVIDATLTFNPKGYTSNYSFQSGMRILLINSSGQEMWWYPCAHDPSWSTNKTYIGANFGYWNTSGTHTYSIRYGETDEGDWYWTPNNDANYYDINYDDIAIKNEGGDMYIWLPDSLQSVGYGGMGTNQWVYVGPTTTIMQRGTPKYLEIEFTRRGRNPADLYLEDISLSSSTASLEEPILFSDESPLKLSLPLTDKEGTTVVDSSIYENDGTLQGDASLSRAMGVNFDGSGDYIQVENDALLNMTNDMTVSTWFNCTSIGQLNVLLSKRYTSDYTAPYQLYINSDNKGYFVLGEGSSCAVASSTTTILPNTWYHVVGRVEGTNVTIYLNGEEEGSDSFSGTRQSNSSPLLIGRYPNTSYYYNGYIRNVQIWDRALTEDEVATLSSTFSPAVDNVGSFVSLSIQPLNDGADRLDVMVGSEELYLTNEGTLDSVTIEDPAGDGLLFTGFTMSDTRGYISNIDGKISTVSTYAENVYEYESLYGVVIGELDSSNDELGLVIEDISHPNNNYYIMTVDVLVTVDQYATAMICVNPGRNDVFGTDYYWTLTQDSEVNIAETLPNGEWVTLQVNTHELAALSASDRLQLLVMVKGDVGETTVQIGQVTVIEVTDLNNTNVNDLLPYGMTSSLKSQGHSIFLMDDIIVLEDTHHDGSDSDMSYVAIDVEGREVTNHTHVSFDWCLMGNVDEYLVAGVALPVIEKGFGGPSFYGWMLYPWPTPNIGYQSSLEAGQAAGVTWLENNPSYDVVYWWTEEWYPPMHDWIDKWYKTYRVDRHLTITLANGYNTSDFTGRKVGPDDGEYSWTYENDQDQDGIPDNVNSWHHTDIPIEVFTGDVSHHSFWGPIKIFIDGNGTGAKFRLMITNLELYDAMESSMGLVGRRLGQVMDYDNPDGYIVDWIASPFYPHYDTESLLPKCNILSNPGFELGYDVSNNTYPNYWDDNCSQQYVKVRTSNSDYQSVEGNHYLELLQENRFLTSTTIDTGNTVKALNDNLLVSMWYQILDSAAPTSAKIQVTVNGVTTSTPTGETDGWTYWQDTMGLTDGDGFTVELKLLSSGSDSTVHCLIDAVRVEPTGWTGEGSDSKVVSSIRSFDPLAMSDLTLHDGWYEITNVNGSPYLDAVDTTAYVTSSEEIAKIANGYTQYFYTELFVDTYKGDFDDQWVLKLEDAVASAENVYGIFLNQQLIWLGVSNTQGLISLSDVPLQTGLNSLMVMQIVERTSAYDSHRFLVKLERPSWSGYSLRTVRPQSTRARTPLIYYDIAYKTKWMTRENEGSNILLNLPLGEGADTTTVIDHACHDNGDIYGDTTWISEAGLDLLDFDGSGDYVRITDAIEPFYWTLSAWVRQESLVQWGKVISKDYRGDGTWASPWISYCLSASENMTGKPCIEVTNFNGVKYSATASTVLQNNQWYFLVGTYDGDELKLYVNGACEATNTSPSGITGYIYNIGDDLAIGSQSPYTNGEYFDGQIRDVQIHDYALTEAEIQQLMLGQHTSYGVVDTPRLITSAINDTFAGGKELTIIGNAERLRYYVTAEEQMQNSSHPKKSIWHPFGTVIMSTDVFPNTVFCDETTSRVERFLEQGGKVLFTGGYVPFGYYSTGPENLTAVGTTGYEYDGALGHQYVLDFEDKNNDEDEDGFDYGMFYVGQQDDDYDEGMDIVNETTPPGYPGQISNLDFLNYEPIVTADGGSVWTQLPHTGYEAHMVITKHEYDVEEYLWLDFPAGWHSKASLYNADGKSGDRSHEKKLSTAPTYLVEETMIAPFDLQLWMKPYLGDAYGGINYAPSETFSQVFYYDVYYEDVTLYPHCFVHHESANVGTGLIQAGTNAKGMIGVMPMFEWEELTGLNVHTDDAADTQGKYADRGYGSVTNSPTTEMLARNLTALITAECVREMFYDAVEVNVCHDGYNTAGPNFLNFDNVQELGGDWENQSVGNCGIEDNLADLCPITIASFATNDGYADLAPQSGYSVYGGSYRKAVANYSAEEGTREWTDLLYDTEGILIGSGEDRDAYQVRPLSTIVTLPEGIVTVVNIDKEPTASYNLNDKAKILTMGGLLVDSTTDVLLHAGIQTNYFRTQHTVGRVVNVSGTSQPTDGYVIGTADAGLFKTYDRYDSTPSATCDWEIIDDDLREFSQYTLSIYDSNDNELVLRDSENVKNTAQSPPEMFEESLALDRVGYYQPLAQNLHTCSSRLASYTIDQTHTSPYYEERQMVTWPYDCYTILDAERLDDDTDLYDNDGDFLYGWWGPATSDFNAAGEYVGDIGDNRVRLDLSSEQEVSDIVIYAGIRPWDHDPETAIDNWVQPAFPNKWYDSYNHPKLLRIILYDSTGKLVHCDNASFAPGNRLDENDIDYEFEPTAPLIYHLEESIDARYIDVEVWSVYDRYYEDPDRYVWLSEIDVYLSQGLPIYGFTHTEAITRVPDYLNYTNTNLSLLMDNGDDQYGGAPLAQRMWSQPRQSSTGHLTIGVKNESENARACRWNFSYSVPISFSSGHASFQDGAECSDFWGQFWSMFQAVIMILILIGIMIGMAMILNYAITPLVGPAVMQALDIMAIAFFVSEFIDTGQLGGWEGSDVYEQSIAFRFLYHYVFDWDGTIIRMVVLHESFDPAKIRFTGYEKE